MRHSRTRASRLHVGGALSVLLLCSALALAGCSESDDGMLSPVANQAQSPDLSFDPANVVEGRPGEVAGGLSMESGPVVYHYYDSGWYDGDDDLELDIADGIDLLVREGAADEDLLEELFDDDEIRVRAEVWVQMTDGEYDWVQFEFNPSMAWDIPVELRLDEEMAASFLQDDEYVLWYLNEMTGAWQVEDVGQQHSNHVTFTLDHFSKWALSDTGTLGGGGN